MTDATLAASAVNYAARSVIVLGDTPAARLIGREMAQRAGAGVVACLPIDEAAGQLPERHTASLILVEVDTDHGADALIPLLDCLEQEAASGRPSIISVPRALLDLAAARAGHRDVTILCEPDALDRAAALALSLARPATHLHDVGTDAGAARLRQLSEEVSRIARSLASLSAERVGSVGLQGIAPFAPRLSDCHTGDPGTTGVVATTIRSMIRARRLRAQFFDAELFADPAWDILLDLTAARLERTPVAVSSLCIAAAVPPTTALRWIKTLTDAGLLVRRADARDGRRVFIDLSDQAADAMTSYFAIMARARSATA